MVRRRIFLSGLGRKSFLSNLLISRPGFQSGLTLIELMIGLSITLIVTSLAVGSHSVYTNFITVSEVNSLLADLYFSRSEALKRHRTMTICQSNDGASCSKGSAWQNGWIIFSDQNRNRKVDEEDQLLRIQGSLRKPAVLTLGSGYYTYIMFSETGEAYPRNTFKFCRSGHPPRAIILFATGRARISQRDSSGKPLKC